jgi:hypothetical protein
MVVEGGSGAARPVEHQPLFCILQFRYALACAEGVGVQLLTVGARDCLIEYVRCILLSSCSLFSCLSLQVREFVRSRAEYGESVVVVMGKLCCERRRRSSSLVLILRS